MSARDLSSASDTTRPSLITAPFVSLSAAALAFYISGGLILPVTPRFVQTSLGGGSAEVGIVFASYAIASLLLRPIVGWSSDRFGRRPLLVGGAVLTVIGMVIHLVATDVAVLIVARSVLGAGEGFFLVAALAAAADLAPAARRGESLSFLSLSLYLGIAIGPLIGETLLGEGNFTLVWLVSGALAVVAVVLAVVTPETAPRLMAGHLAGRESGAARLRTPIIHPAGIFPGLIALAGLWGMAGFIAFLPDYARSIGMGGASLPLLIYGLVVIGGRIVGARVPDLFGPVRVAGVALLLSAVGLTVLGLVPTPAGLIVGTSIFAAGIAFTMPALISLAVSRVRPDERGTVVGTTALFIDVAFGMAPLVLGFIAVGAGTGATFLLSGGIAGLGCVALLARRDALRRSAIS